RQGAWPCGSPIDSAACGRDDRISADYVGLWHCTSFVAVQQNPTLSRALPTCRRPGGGSGTRAYDPKRRFAVVNCPIPKRPATGLRRTGVNGPCAHVPPSPRLDAGRPDPLAPLLGFLGNELAEVGGRAGKHGAAQFNKPRLQLGIGKGGVDL